MQGVGDIVEKDADQPPAPPAPPKPKNLTKKWVTRRRPVVLDPQAAPTPQTRPAQAQTQAHEQAQANSPLSDVERIHLENIRKLQKMTPEEIKKEREEIFRSMDPSVLQSLLRRAEIKEKMEYPTAPTEMHRAPPAGSVADWDPAPDMTPKLVPKAAKAASTTYATPHGTRTNEASNVPVAQDASTATSKNTTGASAKTSAKDVSKDEPNTSKDSPKVVHDTSKGTFDTLNLPKGSKSASSASSYVSHTGHESHTGHGSQGEHPHSEHGAADSSGHKSGVHFPPPPEELRKFFPDLPVETEKLAWMQPIDPAEEAEYSTELTSVAPSELRFDFKGNLITPRMSRMVSTTAGLHHHGDAPAAAGYTLPELSHLCRSSHPAQRAMAIQTAGRVLHKLKLNKFNRSSDLQEGLQALVHTTRIMDTLEEAADEKTRSLTVRTLATEALWLANTKPDTK